MQTLWFGGNFLTMEAGEIADAMVVEDGIILATGKEQSLRQQYPDAAAQTVEGKTVLPAFFDAHGHFLAMAHASLQPSVGKAKNFDALSAIVRSFIETHRPPQGEWILVRDYDDTALAEGAHPTRYFLDHIAPLHPLVLQHRSGHAGIANSLALSLFGILPDTPDPEGGILGRSDGIPNGYLAEAAWFSAIERIPPLSPPLLRTAVQQTAALYLSHGITTVQEGMLSPALIPLYQMLVDCQLLPLDTIAMVPPEAMPAAKAALTDDDDEMYHHHFRIGGYKIFLDGSPQAKTAWMTRPYENADTVGTSTLPAEQLLAALRLAWEEQVPLAVHANGDAAIDQFLAGVETIAAQLPSHPIPPLILIHAQFLRPDQLPLLKKYEITPSFFVAHVYHWGEIHRKQLGEQRAAGISPLASTARAGIPFSLHQDSPVILPDVFETIWAAVCRQTKAGSLLGAEERIPVEAALQAVTLAAAQQYGEGSAKGSLAPGKRADFVILSESPFSIPPERLHECKVLATFVAGECRYRRESLANPPAGLVY